VYIDAQQYIKITLTDIIKADCSWQEGVLQLFSKKHGLSNDCTTGTLKNIEPDFRLEAFLILCKRLELRHGECPLTHWRMCENIGPFPAPQVGLSAPTTHDALLDALEAKDWWAASLIARQNERQTDPQFFSLTNPRVNAPKLVGNMTTVQEDYAEPESEDLGGGAAATSAPVSVAKHPSATVAPACSPAHAPVAAVAGHDRAGKSSAQKIDGEKMARMMGAQSEVHPHKLPSR
jgi:hypothetical protein